MSGPGVPPWELPQPDEALAADDSPQECLYCGLTTRPVSEWAAGAACTRCHGTLDRPPPL